MFDENYEIRTGYNRRHWFVEVFPPLTIEEVNALLNETMPSWAIESVEPTTMFRRFTRATRELTIEAAYGLEVNLKDKGASVDGSRIDDPVDMAERDLTSLF